MAATHTNRVPMHGWLVPIVALAAGLIIGKSSEWIFGAVFAALLIGAVMIAVHHAELVAHWLGEPYGTLVLTLAVTIIELALIVSLMLAGEPSPTLPRDTVHAVVMLVLNGLAGACIVAGTLRHREQEFRTLGASAFLAVLLPMAILVLVLPNHTLTTPGPVYSDLQLEFVSVITILLYAVFLYIQTSRHRDFFVREEPGLTEESPLISGRDLALSIALLLVSLLAVVLLAKKFSLVVDAATAAIGAPAAFAGVVVALLILLPEGVAAVGAARKNDLQKSINLALGSSLATIGLTIPAVAVAAHVMDKELVLGLPEQNVAELVLTFILSMLTFGTGRTNILFGLVHIVVFAIFVFMVFVP